MPPSRRWLALIPLSLFLSLAAYVALGLVVRSHREWLSWLPGDRLAQLDDAYRRAASALFAGDRDGDGFTDGLEWYAKTNPRRATDHPGISIVWSTQAPVSSEEDYLVPPNTVISYGSYIALGGRTRRFHGRLVTIFEEAYCPPGFTLTLAACPGWLTALAGTPLSSQDLVVPVAPDGSFAIDFQLIDKSVPHGSIASHFMLAASSTREMIGVLLINRLWPVASLPVEVTESPLGAEFRRQEKQRPGPFLNDRDARVFQLRWPPLPPAPFEGVIVEALDPAVPDRWIDVHFDRLDRRATTGRYIIVPAHWKSPPGTRPQFRVTAYSLFAPSEK